MNEEWKDIPGYEGLYQASNFGQIRTCEGKTTSSARFKKRIWKQRIMKQKCTTSKKGRKEYRVELWYGSTHKTWLVSRLVALTWCDGYENGLTVNHMDGNPLNNHADNLEWISLADNVRHGFENDLYPQITCYLINEKGQGKKCRSQSEASKSLGHNTSYIPQNLRLNKPLISKDGLQYWVIRMIKP